MGRLTIDDAPKETLTPTSAPKETLPPASTQPAAAGVLIVDSSGEELVVVHARVLIGPGVYATKGSRLKLPKDMVRIITANQTPELPQLLSPAKYDAWLKVESAKAEAETVK
jgi:hypothetical protein